jgi:L-seryl-tRNA(Ser) seleniumtransferase
MFSGTVISMNDINNALKNLPKMDRLICEETFDGMNRHIIKTAADEVLDAVRQNASEGKPIPDYKSLLDMIKHRYAAIMRGSLYRVVNATGVPIHTNLGRSPLSKELMTKAVELASGYCNLEYSVEQGRRGDRYHHAAQYLKMLTGAEDAIIVNNNASAVFLILNTFSRNKETIVSRGELVEIGGSFRIPDVMRHSGAKLCEVGTTNKTRISDYTDAVGKNTAMMMKVHKSNFEIVGFSEEASLAEVAQAAVRCGVMSYYDAGSGLFTRILPEGICPDTTIPEAAKLGFDLISFSGDKMLGGVQAGIIIGSAKHIARLKKNPLMRMLRVDKLTLAAMQLVFLQYLSGGETEIPVNRMLTATEAELKKKAAKLADMLPCETSVTEAKSTIGGGSCPISEIPSYAVTINIKGMSAAKTEKMLRKHTVPIIVRIQNNLPLLDVRTIDESEFEIIKSAIESIA